MKHYIVVYLNNADDGERKYEEFYAYSMDAVKEQLSEKHGGHVILAVYELTNVKWN